MTTAERTSLYCAGLVIVFLYGLMEGNYTGKRTTCRRFNDRARTASDSATARAICGGK